MRMLAGRISSKVLIGSAATLLAGVLFAQETPPAPPPAAATEAKPPAQAPAVPPAPVDAAAKQNEPAAAAALDYLYNRKPQEGTAAKQASDASQRMREKAIAADALGVKRLEDPAVQTRFEKYLALPEVSREQLNAYHTEMVNTINLLRQGKTVDAWKRLYLLAEYNAIDAGVSQELAARIESIWNADRASLTIEQQNNRIRNDIRGASRNADMLSDSVREKEVSYQRRLNENRTNPNQQKRQAAPQPGDGNKAGAITGAPSIDSVIGKLQLTDAYLQNLEAKAKIKLNELKSEKLLEQTKKDFSAYIGTLFKSGRHRHVILAADFYRRIFDAFEYPVAVAQQVNASLEMAREIQNAIEVVKSKTDGEEIAVATEQLQNAFLTNEFDFALLGLGRTYKTKIEKFCRAINKMQNLMEAREFTDLEALLGEMKQIAPDFDATKVKAIVNAVKLEGQLRLGKAKLAAQQGDLKQAMQEFQAAAEVWPNNPDLKDKALTFFETQDVMSESLREFDRLVKEGNYRAIFDKQLAFAPAMKDDTARQEQLKSALEKVKLAEMATEKANLLRANGDVFGAWETVELAVADLPGDTKLNTLRGELVGKGAEFVAAINRAKEAESRKELGFSLTWYAIAQRHYPASQMANKAIERISKELLTPAPL